MPIEQQVCSLELAKRLKELGVAQKALFFYGECCPGGVFYAELHEAETAELGNAHSFKDKPHYAAFTVAEFGEIVRELLAGGKGLTESDFCDDFSTIMDMTKAEIWALNLIRGIEKGYIETRK